MSGPLFVGRFGQMLYLEEDRGHDTACWIWRAEAMTGSIRSRARTLTPDYPASEQSIRMVIMHRAWNEPRPRRGWGANQ